MLMKKVFLSIVLTVIMIFVLPLQSKSQTSPDSLFQVVPILSKPKIWKPALEVFSTNMLVWGFNRFILNKECGNINWNTIKYNFKKGPTWDTDQFGTNLFAHPYHGSLYFNAAREEGFNFWQSIPFVIGGSFMWEFFMENEPPSINDMLATTFGGIGLGEVTFRLSDRIQDNSSGGIERVGRELAMGLLSPVKAFNRLISGEMWKRTTVRQPQYSRAPIQFSCDLGGRLINTHNGDPLQGAMHIGLFLEYGELFKAEIKRPYDWFKLHASFNVITKQPFVNEINIIGALWTKQVIDKPKSDMTVGFFQHFDFYDSGTYTKKIPERKSNDNPHTGYPSEKLEVPPYRIGAPVALGGGLVYQKRKMFTDRLNIDAAVYANAILLGASLSDYMYFEQRDYNLGSGYGIKAHLKLDYLNRLSLTCSTDNFQIFTWKGYAPDFDWSNFDPNDYHSLNVQGDRSDAILRLVSYNLKYNFNKHLNLSFTNRYFYRQTHYRYRVELTSKTTDWLLNVGYTF